MSKERYASGLEPLLERLEQAAKCKEDRVSLERLLKMVGRRSYGAILLLAGLIILAPLIGDIPGVPTLIALVVVLVTPQLLAGREVLWLPQWLMRQSIEKEKLINTVEWLQKPARYIDRYLHPRLTVLIDAAGLYIIAGVCLLIAIVIPLLEFIPFSANGAGMAFTIFGLALIARDGLMTLIAISMTLATFLIVGVGVL